MHLFYTPDISTTDYLLNEEESKHCIRVLRLQIGDFIYLIDGLGGFYKGVITSDNAKRCTVSITETTKERGKRNFHLHIAIAPTKDIERFEWFLEKATEIGIDEITPIITARSERRIIKTERLNKIIVSAMKQSMKAYLPKLNEMIDYNTFIQRNIVTPKYIAHCEESKKRLLQEAYRQTSNALILIGPEGDFSTSEIELARSKNFTEISLGNSRLRTETAGIVACHTVNLLNCC